MRKRLKYLAVTPAVAFRSDPAQAMTGGVLASLPIWASALSEWAAVVASVCGAILGLGAVIRMIRNWFRERRNGHSS